MSSNINQQFQEKLNYKVEIDSSELSSDSDLDTDVHEISDISNPVEQKEKILSNELAPSKRIIIEKRPRFFSESKEDFKFNKIFRSHKLKIITDNLKKFAEDEMVDLNKRKFSFI